MTEDKILIVKKKNNRLNFNVRKKTHKGYSPNDYSKVLNPCDANDFATLMEDLNLLFNVPVEKSFNIYRTRRGRTFPF